MSTFVNGKGGGITDPEAFKLALGVSTSVLSVQDLRDVDVSNIGSAAIAEVFHHTSSQDIGGGTFVWVSNSTEPDNNVSVFLPTGRSAPGRWIRYEALLYPAVINVAWTGAIPNAVGYDNSPHFNEGIQALPLYASNESFVIPGGFMRRGILEIPGGNWYVSNTINASQGMGIVGVGPSDSIIVLNSGAVGYQDANVEKWILYYHRDEDLPYNNVFGTRARDFGISGSYQPGSSGIFISGAQGSHCERVNIGNLGIRGGVFNVPSNEVWVANCIKGPGFTTSIGPRMNHGAIRSEHVNQDGTHLMELYQNPPTGPVTVNIPCPAFFFDGSYQAIVEHIQGEDSFFEVVVRDTVDLVIRSCASRRIGPAIVSGRDSTFLYLFGDTYNIKFDDMAIAVPYQVKVFDNTGLALQQVDTGAQTTDFWKNRNALFSSNINPIYPGPYANDAAAAASKQVPIGAGYRVTGGNIAWRQV